MASPTSETLPTEAQLALAYSRPAQRGRLTVFLELDYRLGRIVAGTSEPMLGQMRLAWWRDTLGQPAKLRPSGDAVLDGIARHWQGSEASLCSLVDGWENLLRDPPLGEDAAREFLAGRSSALAEVYPDTDAVHHAAAWWWACADLAAKVSLEEERALFQRLGGEKGFDAKPLPGNARSLAVLGALGRRALKRGGRPLMEGRGASLTAARAAIVGR